MEGWNATRLAAAAAIGALLFIINVCTGMLIVIATGIPLAGAIIMGLFVGIIIALTELILPIFPSATIMTLVYGILAIPTPISGPPGFLPKVLIVASAGFVADVVMSFFRKNEKIGVIISTIIASVVAFIIFLLAFYIFLPKDLFAKFFSVFHILLVVCVIEGAIGAYIGWIIFDKIKDRNIVKRLRGK